MAYRRHCTLNKRDTNSAVSHVDSVQEKLGSTLEKLSLFSQCFQSLQLQTQQAMPSEKQLSSLQPDFGAYSSSPGAPMFYN